MVEQLLNSLLFYFFSAEFRCREKVRDPPNYPRSVICWDIFLYFWGHFGVTTVTNSRSALYRAETIRDQLFVWNFFFINNGRHRTTALYRFPRSIGPRYNGAAVYLLKNDQNIPPYQYMKIPYCLFYLTVLFRKTPFRILPNKCYTFHGDALIFLFR